MNSPDKDPLSEWLTDRRNNPSPQPNPDFSDEVLESLHRSQSPTSPIATNRLLQIAALIAVGAIGFFRLELFSQLIILSL